MQGENKSREVVNINLNENRSVALVLIRRLSPIRKKTTEMVSVGNDSLIKGYSKHPVMSVIILMAAMGNPICLHIFLTIMINEMPAIISSVVVAQ